MALRTCSVPAARVLARGFLAALAMGLAHLEARAGAPPDQASQAPPAVDGPLTPADSQKAFRLAPGLRIELVAAEPMVVSPVACAFDARGRLFVAENRAYPTGPGEGKPPMGRIALLEDSDGDGAMDRRHEFAEGLTFPNGVMPWKGGVLVTCAPEVLWLRDTNGDGKADERKVLFTGFSTQGSTQLRVSHPTLSPDNWIYLTSGLTGGSVTSPALPAHKPVELVRTDFRFRPDGQTFESADGGSQFGLTFDDFGRRFICYNRVQVQHVVISSATLRRNPLLAFSETVQNCPADMGPEPLKGHGRAARLYPISRNVTTADSHAGTFTAACAVTVFRGSGLPDLYRGCVFSCDPTGNLVHSDRLEPAGATFSARPVHDGVEFVASTDNWMRPVFLAQGPDGALYFCDMYRKTIEHPDYLPEEVRKRTDFDGGKTMGRIWRVVRSDRTNAELAPLRRVDLESAGSAQLVSLLEDRDGWRRETAHRLLLERADPATRTPLAELVSRPSAPPAAVVLSLSLLESLGALETDLLRQSFRHATPGVREYALRLGESRLHASPALASAALPLCEDPDPRVRFQAAITLGDVPRTGDQPDPVPAALASVAARDGHDRWLRAALLSSLAGRETRFLEALKQRSDGATALVPELLVELGKMLARAVPAAERSRIVHTIVSGRGPGAFCLADQASLLAGLAESIHGGNDPLTALAAGDSSLAASIHAIEAAMIAIARNASASQDQRRAAVDFLGFASFDHSGAPLLALMDPAQPLPLQVAAVRALGRSRDPRVAAALLEPERFGSYMQAIRDEVLAALLAQSAHAPAVLEAVSQGRIPLGVIDAASRRQLVQHPDPAIRRRAEAVFGQVSADRAGVYDAYKDVITMPPDAVRGRAVFKRECAQCHRLDQEGVAVGPDLFGIRNQPKEAILLHLLVPDHEITQGFTAYTVATNDGRVLSGLIASESPTSITLRQALGKEDTIPRDQIEQLTASRQSLMPQGLEKSISRQEFADLLAYLKGEATGAR